MVALEVRSLKDALADAARVMKSRRVEREARMSFATPELLWQVLTAKRWKLLKALCGAGAVSLPRRREPMHDRKWQRCYGFPPARERQEW